MTEKKEEKVKEVNAPELKLFERNSEKGVCRNSFKAEGLYPSGTELSIKFYLSAWKYNGGRSSR
jgi:hypothetical protein